MRISNVLQANYNLSNSIDAFRLSDENMFQNGSEQERFSVRANVAQLCVATPGVFTVSISLNMIDAYSAPLDRPRTPC